MGAGKRVEDLMQTDVKTVRRNDVLRIADDVMRQERIRHLPVVSDDGEQLLGVLSQRDLFRGALARALGYGEHAQDALLGQLRIKDVMSNEPVIVAPDTPLEDAARLMLDRKIGCLPVIQGDRLVGLLSESDFVARCAGKR